MPGRRASQLCPHAIFVKGQIAYYAKIGRQIREIFHRYTPIVQPLSLDEAFLDVAGCIRLHGSPATIGQAIKDAIRNELDLTASVGIAPLKFVAKIASDLNKPDGFVEVSADGVLDFLDPLPIERLWGVGRVGQEKLRQMGIQKVGDLRRLEIDFLKHRFGNWGEHLWKLANGIDERKVVPDHIAKGIGHERTFHEDIVDEDMLRAVVSYLSQQVARRLRRHQRLARTISIKYRRDDFKTFTRSRTLPRPTDTTNEIFQTAAELLDAMRKHQPRPVRLVGVSVGSLTGVDAPQQLSLFDLNEGDGAQKEVDKTVDSLTDRLGDAAVYRGTSHDWLQRKKKK